MCQRSATKTQGGLVQGLRHKLFRVLDEEFGGGYAVWVAFQLRRNFCTLELFEWKPGSNWRWFPTQTGQQCPSSVSVSVDANLCPWTPAEGSAAVYRAKGCGSLCRLNANNALLSLFLKLLHLKGTRMLRPQTPQRRGCKWGRRRNIMMAQKRAAGLRAGEGRHYVDTANCHAS